MVPAADEVATKHDVFVSTTELREEMVTLRLEMGELRGEMRELRGEMREGFATLRGEIHQSSKETMRWMLTFFIPVWAGTWGTVLAILLKH